MFTLDNFWYFIALTYTGCVLTALFVKTKTLQDFYNIIIFFLISFVGRIFLIVANESLGFFKAKLAGNASLRLYRHFLDNPANAISSKFFPQTLLNIPGFALFGADRTNMLFTNAFLGALAGIVAFAYLYRLYNIKVAYNGLFLTSFYPAAINFSIFGLRDLVIYFFSITYILSFISFVKNKKSSIILDMVVILFSLLMLFQLRKSSLLIIITLPIVYFIYQANKKTNKIRDKSDKQFVKIIVSILILIVLSVVGISVYRLTTAQIGGTGTVSPVEIAEQYGQSRYDRQFKGGDDGGGGSAILPPAVYRRTNAVTRIPLQSLGMIIIPFPWLLTNVSRLLAFVDSLFIMYSLYWAFKAIKIKLLWQTSERIFLLALVAAFFVGIISFGMLVINAGNAFRMRVNIAPYLFVATSLVLDFFRNKKSKNQINR